MWFECFVALRYLKAKRKQAAISIISIISVLGIVIGVMALVIALAVSTGFKEEFQSKLLGATAHLNIEKEDSGSIENYKEVMHRVKGIPHIAGVAPTIYDQVFLSGSTGSLGVHLKGIDPTLEKNVSDILRYIIGGNAYDIAEPPIAVENSASKLEGIILGKELAKNLGVSLGDIVTLVSSQGRLSPLGMTPRFKKFKVVAIFSSGLWDQDSNWAYISIRAAQRLASLSENEVTFIECKVDDIYRVKEIGASIVAYFKDQRFITTNWIDLNKPLFSALKFDKLITFVTIGLIVLVASLNVVIILTMMVIEKQKDIAILSAMGATEKTITWIFILQGLIVGIIGTTIGSVVGFVTCWILDRHHMISLEPQIYSISYVPFRIRLTDFALVIVFSIIISFLATIYPARSAAGTNPVDVLRYE